MKPQDMKDLRELIEFLKQYQVAEFDLDRGDLKIRLKFAEPPSPAATIADLAIVSDVGSYRCCNGSATFRRTLV